MVINGQSDLSKLDNLGFFWKKIPGQVSLYSIAKTHTKQKSYSTVFYTLEIEMLTAPNLLIGCLETWKQETLSHCCQDQPFKTLFMKSQACLPSRVLLSGSLQPSTAPFAGELHHILLSQWDCGKTQCHRESSRINFLSFFNKMPRAVQPSHLN